MITRKKKQCIDCKEGELRYLYGRKRCLYHYTIHMAKENKVKNKSVVDVDEKFYAHLWKIRKRYCSECAREIKIRTPFIFHHILPKRRGAGGYSYFRHEPRNVIMLCRSCHGKAESAISYPKMNIFPFCESMKAILLSEVGLTYESKIA